MRSKTIVYCEGLKADGTPCDSHFENENTHAPVQRRLPPGWWEAHVTKVIPPREMPPQPNIFERGPLRQMMKAIAESVTPTETEKSDEILATITRLETAIGDVGNGPLQVKLAADLAAVRILTAQVVQTPEKIEEQLQKMMAGLKSGYDAGTEEEAASLPPRRDRLYAVTALLCDKHPQPEVQFDESKVPFWAGQSLIGCDHDYEVDLLGGSAGGVQVAAAHPVGFGG